MPYVYLTHFSLSRTHTGVTVIIVQGLSGAPGRPGEPGLQGSAGEPGNPGYSGMPGRRGNNGRKGYPGDPGYNGRDGQNGQRGANGEPGAPGRDGYTPTSAPAGPPVSLALNFMLRYICVLCFDICALYNLHKSTILHTDYNVYLISPFSGNSSYSEIFRDTLEIEESKETAV